MDIEAVPFLRMESHSENNPIQRVKATLPPKRGGVDNLIIDDIINQKINIIFEKEKNVWKWKRLIKYIIQVF